jgi:dihydroxy-acid dehydratase
MRRAQWTALGLTDEDMEKPKIAIVNSSSGLASCFSHLDGIVGPLKQAITDAGGVAFEVRTAAPSDAITSAGAAGQYILPSRDLIASDIEVAVEGALLDGMVCLASCDKTTPGQLMAAGRLNIPTIVVACGYQASGIYRGESVDFEDIFRFAGHVATGAMTVSELAEMSSCAVTGPGVCAGMGTANSMHIAAEALGMALPGCAPVLAGSPKMWQTVAGNGELRVTGPAKVYRSRDEGVSAISRGEVQAGDVLVLTGLGLRGAPGMGFTSAFVFALDGAGCGWLSVYARSVRPLSDGATLGG